MDIDSRDSISTNVYSRPMRPRREPQQRIFANRGLQMEKIKFFGFDMDYTLACYKSPAYETLAFDLIRDRLLDIGYPEAIGKFSYDHSFPIRGLWFDKLYGNLVKVDQYGNILCVVHGFNFLSPQEIRKFYPNKFLQLSESRCYVLNTLFNLPETHMLACLVNFFDSQPDSVRSEKGVQMRNVFMSYKSIFQDVRGATDYIHIEGTLKQCTLEDLDTYVHRDSGPVRMLQHLRSNGAKLFLLTNSDYEYTNAIMSYIMKNENQEKSWMEYFDHIFVDSRKPLFFQEGTLLRRVDTTTGRLNIGSHIGPLETGHVYSGGSCEVISKLIGARGKDVLYIGDHIFGDILKSKKIVGWRTFLVVPELNEELYVWKTGQPLYSELERLDEELRMSYRYQDSESQEKPHLSAIKTGIRNVVQEMDAAYGTLGSLFRCGSRQTFFSGQVMRYADLYAHSCVNLLYYPRTYMFRSIAMRMPHEATVAMSTAGSSALSTVIVDSVPEDSVMTRGSGTVDAAVGLLIDRGSAQRLLAESKMAYRSKSASSQPQSVAEVRDHPGNIGYHPDLSDSEPDEDSTTVASVNSSCSN